MELIEEKNQAQKVRRKKEKEKEEEELNEEESGKWEDEADEMVDKEKREDKEGKEEGASDNSPLRLLDQLTNRHHPTPRPTLTQRSRLLI